MNEAPKRFADIFVVIDPTRMIQSALIKAEAIARLNGARLTAYCCIFDSDANEVEADKKAWMAMTRDWLSRMLAAPRSDGIEINIELEWNEDWRLAMVNAATRANCDLLIKNSSKHSVVGRMLTATSDWMLLRRAISPTLLVSDRPPRAERKLLAAIKLKPEDAAHEQLNERIIDLSHYISEAAGFEMHAVTAYRGDDLHYDRQRFADACRLPRNRVHSVEGAPQNAIAEAAAEIGADTIVIGDPEGSETAQKLIDQVDTDVLVLPSIEE